ncbi:MAG: hypothetical protein ABJP45_17460 [Cyclobacteriaceae bacterium]
MLLLVAIFACNEKKYAFERVVDCEEGRSKVNSNLRKIFKPCREYVYRARYWDNQLNLISDDYIWMMATGRDWAYEPESQDEIAIQYAVDSSKIDFIKQYTINPEFSSGWREGEVTGIIETEETVWMHPFRSNQYLFTQVAAFPYVKLPLERSTQWTSSLNIYENWGQWSNHTLSSTYRVLDFEKLEIEFGDLDAWHINATETADFGTSVHDFWFNEDYGFVKMVINNYAGQVLIFELVEVKDS